MDETSQCLLQKGTQKQIGQGYSERCDIKGRFFAAVAVGFVSEMGGPEQQVPSKRVL